MPQSTDFIQFAVDTGVLSFGRFTTKAGRASPYFFNAGGFHDGQSLGHLADFYADRLQQAVDEGLQYDMLFGPAYKGITLAATTAVALASRHQRAVPFAFNRKETKDHGEGGLLVGAPLAGRVVIIDDVISAGTSVRESVQMIRAAGAIPAAVLIAMDRMERGGTADAPTARSAVQEVQAEFGLPVLAIATLDDLFRYLDSRVQQVQGTAGDAAADALTVHREAVAQYRTRYGVSASAD